MSLTISGDSPNFSTATITTGTVTTLNAPSGVLATQNGMTGIAKAWVLYNQKTTTILNSFNVSSVTYVATGSFTINFTTAMANANYAIAATIRDTGGNGTYDLICSSNSGSFSTTSLPMTTWNINGSGTPSAQDFNGASVIVFGS